jgi:MFS transporter, ACS family, hexuronate transporter
MPASTRVEGASLGAGARPVAQGLISSRWLVAALATLVMAVSYIDRQTLAVLGPTVTKALHLTLQQYGWIVSAFSIAYLFGAPLSGALLDRTGARRGLVFAVLAWSIVAASQAFVPSFAVLFALRVLLGTAESPSFPGAAQTMKRILPPGERSIGFGLLFTGSSIGAMVAAPLAIGIFHVTGDWRTAFFGTAVIGLSWIPIWLLVTRSPAVRGALAAPARDENDDGTAARLLFTRASVLRALMLVVFTAPCIMFGLNWTSQYLAHTFAISQDGLAKFAWLPPLGFDLGAVVFGALASRADRRVTNGEPKSHVTLVLAAGLLAATMAAMPLAQGPWLGTALITISLAGGAGIFALLTADMLARVGASQVSAAGGLTAAAQSLAYVVANPMVGRAVDLSHSYGTVLVVLGAIVPPAVVAWSLWPVPRCASSTR